MIKHVIAAIKSAATNLFTGRKPLQDALINGESGSSNNCCDNSIVPPPITAANSMTRLIAGYQVSDMIKFDRVATSATPVLAYSRPITP